jgi:hypothetical protein
MNPTSELQTATMDWNQDCVTSVVLLASTLSITDLKKLLRKHLGSRRELPTTPEALLETLHQACHRDAGLVEFIGKKLDRKFGAALVKIHSLSSEEVNSGVALERWPVPLMWACLRNQAPEMRANGHRLAHRLVWRGMKQLLAGPETADLKQQLEDAGRRSHSQQAEIQKLKAEVQHLKRNHWMLAASRPLPATGSRAADPVPHKEVVRLRQEIKSERRRNEDLAQELASWRKLALCRPDGEVSKASPFLPERPHACPLSSEIRRGDMPCQREERGCPLAGRCIAIIGGLDRLEPTYRKAVDELGGECICHNGKIRGGCRRLKQTVAKADVVVFITTINSHAALTTVKAECKRCSTPFCVLGRSGAGSLEQALLKLAV